MTDVLKQSLQTLFAVSVHLSDNKIIILYFYSASNKTNQCIVFHRSDLRVKCRWFSVYPADDWVLLVAPKQNVSLYCRILLPIPLPLFSVAAVETNRKRLHGQITWQPAERWCKTRPDVINQSFTASLWALLPRISHCQYKPDNLCSTLPLPLPFSLSSPSSLSPVETKQNTYSRQYWR